MVQAIVWKEFREQGLIGLTLLVLGSGVLVTAAVLGDPPTDGAGPADVVRFLGAGRLAALMLAVTAGTVCGGALFAAEREAGTLGFLEALPAARWDLWRGKLAAGVALVVCQVVPLLGLAAALGLVGSGPAGLQLGLSALHAFVWGVFGSTVARTTLGSVGVAIPAAVLAAIVYTVPVFLLFHHPRTSMLKPEGGLLLLALMFATPLALSAYLFTRPDRDRAADRVPGAGRWLPVADTAPAGPAPAARRTARFGVRALLWLTARQLRLPGAVGAAFALAFGLALLLPGFHPVLAWPPLALAAGVFAGVTVFADEQAHGSARFWGERRLPAGRAWAAKVAMHALFALGLVAVLILPSVIRGLAGGGYAIRPGSALSAAFGTLLFDDHILGAEGWKFLLLPAAYGFAAGHLCGLLFRKAVVATGVAGLLGGTAAALWAPSLLAGGVHHWQVWLPPAVALLTARLLVRPWAADRVPTRGPLTALGVGSAAALLVLAAGIGYRAVEVPADPAGADDQAYVQGLPPIDKNDGGREFRTTAEKFARAADAAGPPGPSGTPDRVAVGLDEADRAAPWLARVYAVRPGENPDAAWHADAARVAVLPVGLYEHPLTTGTTIGAAAVENGRRMGTALVAHGLWRQKAGDPGAFVADLRTALALGRNLRNGSITAALRHGQAVARTALFGTDQWLRNLDGRPDLVRAAAAEVWEDDRAVLTRWAPGRGVVPPAAAGPGEEVPFDPTPHLLAERYVVREKLKAPGQWLPDDLTPAGRNRDLEVPVADLAGFGWATPWERERTRRLVESPDRGRTPGYARLVRGRPGARFLLDAPNPDQLAEQDRDLRALRRAVLLHLAVRLYQADHAGAPPPDLAALAPTYLPAVPDDPYGDGAFRYRVVRLAEVPAARRPSWAFAAGRPVVWSVGPDRADGGGWDEAVGPGDRLRTRDLVYPLPLPAPQPPGAGG